MQALKVLALESQLCTSHIMQMLQVVQYFNTVLPCSAQRPAGDNV
jgi:hypothetical protein